MKYLLHIDTSTDVGTVAIAADGQLIAHRQNVEQRNHAGTINTMIAGVLKDAGITFQDLAAIAVCAGPGSYTGLRIGMATAKGLCYALAIPLILEDRLTLLAYQAYQQQGKSYAQYAILLMAREKEYFITVYNNDFICTLRPQHILEAQLFENIGGEGEIYLVTDAAEQMINAIENSHIKIISDTKIDLPWWAFYSFDEYNCNKSVNSFTAEPFYLKQVYTHK